MLLSLHALCSAQDKKKISCALFLDKVYAVGMVEKLSLRSKASDLLKKVTKETGGRVVFAKSDRDDLQRLLADLAIAVP